MLRAIWIELPLTEGEIQETLAEADNDSVPSPALAAVTVCVGPFWPTTKGGPTVAGDRLNIGVQRLGRNKLTCKYTSRDDVHSNLFSSKMKLWRGRCNIEIGAQELPVGEFI